MSQPPFPDSANPASPPPVVDSATSSTLRSESDQQHRTRGFSLASLFLLITACGTLVSLWLPLVTAIRQGKVDARNLITICLITGVAGIGVGMITGVLQRRPLQGLALGAGLGMILGLFLGPVTLVPDEHVGALIRSSLFGSLAILAVAVALRRL